jgi:hypothetical protein
VRTSWLLVLSALLFGCSRESPMPTLSESGPSQQQVDALHAANTRLAAKITQMFTETKKLPETMDALRAWATGANSWTAEDEKLLGDPWGRPVFLGINAVFNTFTIRSSGPDRTDKTPDDLIYDSRDKSTKTFKDRNG